jgi:hypothetical protein
LRLHIVLVGLFLVLAACLAGCDRVPTKPPATYTALASSTPMATLTALYTSTSSPSATVTPAHPSPTPSYLPTLTPFTTEITFDVVGQIGGYTSAIAVKDKVAYLGVGPQVLVLDVSDPHLPKQIGQSGMLPGMVWDIAVDNGLIYVAVGSSGLHILDLSNPNNPREVGSVDTEHSTDQILIHNQIAFVAEHTGNDLNHPYMTRLLDIIDPVNPSEITRLDGHIMDIQGNYAYIDQDEGMIIMDISDPRSVRMIANTGLDGVGAISGQYAYTIDVISDTLGVIDITDPGKPQELGDLIIENDYLDHLNGVIVIDNTYIYLQSVCWGESAYRSSTLYLVDVSNPANPSLVTGWTGTGSEQKMGGMSGGIVDVILTDGLLYMAKGDTYSGNGLFILDVSEPMDPREVGSFHVFSTAVNAVGIGNYAYVHNGHFPDYLNLVDLTNMKNIQDRGTFLHVMGGDNMNVVGDYILMNGNLYLDGATYSASAGLILDVTDPANPLPVGQAVSGMEDFISIDVFDHYVCVRQLDNTIGFYDLSYPSRPRQISRIKAERATYITCTENMIFYGEYQDYPSEFSTLHIVGQSDGTQPRELSTTDITDGVIDLAFQNGFLYIIVDPGSIWDDASLIVLDVSDVMRPQQVASMRISKNPNSITIQDHYAYIANGDVTVIDISDPANPRPVGFFDTPGNTQNIMAINNTLYVSAGRGGLIILHVHK